MRLSELHNLLDAYSDGDPDALVVFEHRGEFIPLNSMSNVTWDGAPGGVAAFAVAIQSETPDDSSED